MVMSKSKKKARFMTRISQELKDKLRSEAQRRGISMTELFEQIISKELNKDK